MTPQRKWEDTNYAGIYSPDGALDAALEVAQNFLNARGTPAVKLFANKESYRAGDRIFAILQRPDVALLLTCDAPASWTAMLFDFGKKQAVAAASNQTSIAEAQKYAIAQVKQRYKVAVPEVEIQWQQALNRPDILQT
jgi:hypothetical protein